MASQELTVTEKNARDLMVRKSKKPKQQKMRISRKRQQKEILAYVSAGQSLEEISKLEDMPTFPAMMAMLYSDTNFYKLYDIVKKASVEIDVDRMKNLSHRLAKKAVRGDVILPAQVASVNSYQTCIKWIAERTSRKRYYLEPHGDTMERVFEKTKTVWVEPGDEL